MTAAPRQSVAAKSLNPRAIDAIAATTKTTKCVHDKASGCKENTNKSSFLLLS
jgi:hypothetical protein